MQAQRRMYWKTLFPTGIGMLITILIMFGLSVIAATPVMADSPYITDTDPDSLEEEVSRNLEKITVTFDVAMDAATLNSDNIKATGTSSQWVDADSITYDDGTKTMSFYPSVTFEYGEWIRMYLFDEVESSEGDPLLPPGGYNFLFLIEHEPDPCWAIDTVHCETDYENFQIFFDTLTDQVEFSVDVNPIDPLEVFIGANVHGSASAGDIHQGIFRTTDGGDNWTHDTLTSSFGAGVALDPAVGFGPDGDVIYMHMQQDTEYFTRAMASTPYPSWSDIDTISAGNGEDRGHLIVDQISADQSGYAYAAWTDLDDHLIRVARRLPNWPDFGDPTTLSNDSTEYGLGVNLAVAPNGYVYAAWSVRNQSMVTTGIGFARSTDGGEFWEAAKVIVAADGVRDSSPGLPPKQFNARTSPVLAVDARSNDTTGTIYLVWDDERNGDADIMMVKSENGGASWDSGATGPYVLNDDETDTDQYFPWVDVDPCGGVNVVFYDCRNDADSNFMTEVWMARSTDGGSSFSNFRVGEVAFAPCPLSVSGKAGKYIGDYIGMASTEDYIYPVWADSRVYRNEIERGVYQAFAAKVPVPRDTASGLTTENAEWTCTVYLEDSLVIAAGDTVTINQWTRVLVEADAGTPPKLIVKGHLKLDGGITRPRFVGSGSSAGEWYGIVVDSGGSVDWGDGCLITDAVIGVTVEEDADTMTIAGVRIENCDSAGFVLKEDVSLVNDTIIDAGGIGVYVDVCDPDIDDVYIEDCEVGVYAKGSSGTLTDSKVYGPGGYGIKVISSGGGDTLTVSGMTVQYRPSDSARFWNANLWCGSSGHADVDDCEFIADTTYGNRTTYGVYASTSAWVKVRNTTIHDFASYGFYSFASNANLGMIADSGFNSIRTPLSPSSRAYHTSLLRGPGSGNMQARGNWWGTSSPDSSWFTNVDFTPYLSSDPLARMFMPSAVAQEAALPEHFTLRQNYPNPFNPATIIEFYLPAAAHARVEIFNILGQKVKDLVDRDLAAGRHQVAWDGTNGRGRVMPSGVYLYRIMAGDFIETKKMVLLK